MKEKKTILPYLGLMKIFPKVFFAHKTPLAVEKKHNFGANFQIFCVAIKNGQSYNFRIWKLYGKHFFQKKVKSVFFLPPVCSTVLKKPQKWFNFFFESFSKMYENCMTSIFSVHLMYEFVW